MDKKYVCTQALSGWVETPGTTMNQVSRLCSHTQPCFQSTNHQVSL